MITFELTDTHCYIEYSNGLKIYKGRAYVPASNPVNSYYKVNYPSQFSKVINLETNVIRDTSVEAQKYQIEVLFGVISGGFCFRDVTRQSGAGYVIDYTITGY